MTLHTLHLSGNNIGTDAAISLAESLVTNTTLHTLYLRDNIITPEEASEIANILDLNYTLIDIGLNIPCDKISEIVNRNIQIKEIKPFKTTRKTI